jgi:hypothetical protein
MIVGGKHTSVLHHTQWVEALGALLIGTLAALSALVMGQHCALLLYHKLNPGAFIPYGSPAPEQNKLEGVDVGVSGGADTAEDWAEGEADGLNRRFSTVSSIRKGSLTVVVVDGGQQQQQQQQVAAEQRLQSLSSFSKADGRLFTGSVQLAAVAPQHRPSTHTTSSSSLQQPGATLAQPPPLPTAAAAAAAASEGGVLRSQAPLSPEAKPGSGSESNGGAAAAIPSAVAAAGGATAVADAAVAIGGGGTAVEDEVDEEEPPSRSVSQWVVDGFAVVTILVLTGEASSWPCGWIRVFERVRSSRVLTLMQSYKETLTVLRFGAKQSQDMTCFAELVVAGSIAAQCHCATVACHQPPYYCQ